MKFNRFKIRPIQHKFKQSGFNEGPATPVQSAQGKRQSKVLLQQMQQMLKYALSLHSNNESTSSQLEHRDRAVHSNIKATQQQALDNDSLEEWIGEVCRNVMSTTFNYYINEDMSFQQAKVYCCQQILKNISSFAEKHEISSTILSDLDKIMKKKVMPYLAQKYPLSETLNVNRSLNRVVKEINNMEVTSNDFFYNSNINLEYRENGNYNDIIMRVLNELISLADEQSPNVPQCTNFNDFDEYITRLFDKVYDPLWMNSKQSSGDFNRLHELTDQMLSDRMIKEMKNTEQIQKFKEKVQEYTQYETSRKIPEGVQTFTEDQIRKGHLVIKAPSILRIMTKWCQELWVKYEDENYYIDRSEGLTMLNSKQINVVYEWLKLDLKKRLKDEKSKIEKYMKNIERNLYDQQFKILQSQICSKEAPFLNKYERVCGKFSTKVINNLKNCVVLYLNRLIHGLMQISHSVFTSRMKGMPSWPNAPNLISFKIGDLLRCRISSRERQIIRLYLELQDISENNPDKLKIIRVKNRLKSGTNDLLLNVRYNSSYTAEIQLKVKSKINHSRFSNCSYNFSHFIYEIQRSYFGPISEMCSIWTNLDPRTTTYESLVTKQNLNANINNFEYYCQQNSLDHQFESISNTPFICSNCGKSYTSDNFVLTHKNCKLCNFYKCCSCQVKQRQNDNLVDEIVENEQIRESIYHYRCQIIPSLGVCIRMENNTSDQAVFFKMVQALEKQYIFFKKENDDFEFVRQLKTEKQRKQFLNDYIVYEYCGIEPQYCKKLTLERALKQFITPTYMKKCFHNERQAISLNKISNVIYETQVFEKFLKDPKEAKRSVKQIEISSQNLKSSDILPDDMVNLELINFNLNALTSIQSLQRFKRLKFLYLLSNQLDQFPAVLCDLPLKLLNIGQNNIKTLPDEFEKLQHLQNIRFDSNKMEQFPTVLTKLVNLQEIIANSNRFTQLPEQIQRLKKVKYMNVSNNKLETLPQSFRQLQCLEYLDISGNNIVELKVEIQELTNLKTLLYVNNKTTDVPKKLKESSIRLLDLSTNKIQNLNLSEIELGNVEQFKAQRSNIRKCLGFNMLKNVAVIRVPFNTNLEQLPEDICQLKLLKRLFVNGCRLKKLPDNFYHLASLEHLNLSQNKGIVLPSNFGKLKLQYLNVSSCGLTEFFSITQMKLLKELIISENSLKEIPPEIKDLKNLEVFEFFRNQIKQIPAQFLELKRLSRISYKQKSQISLKNIFTVFFKMNQQSLELPSSNIQSLPEDIPFNSELQILRLNQNKIVRAVDSLKNIVNLKILDLSHNKLSEVDEGIFNLKELKILKLDNNCLQSIPDKFNKFKKLDQLSLSNNQLTKIPDTIEKIYRKEFIFTFEGNKGLRAPLWMVSKDFKSLILDLDDYQLSALPHLLPIQKYCNIKLSQNKFTEIPKQLFKLNKIKSLYLKDNQIRVISSQISVFKQLTTLCLSNNLIEQIPAQLAQTAIQNLEILNNPLKKIAEEMKTKVISLIISPETFSELDKNGSLSNLSLSVLSLKNQSLTELPQQIGNIYSVTALEAQENQLIKLPDSISKMKTLSTIDMSNNHLQFLPESFGGLEKLTILKLSNCKLKSLPSSFGKLPLIKTIDLSKNELEDDFPQSMEQIQTCTQLNLSQNRLTIIPGFLAKWKIPLLYTYFSDNSMKQIPDWIGSSTIAFLDLQRNLIEQIPESIATSAIKNNMLCIAGNPIRKVNKYKEIAIILKGLPPGNWDQNIEKMKTQAQIEREQPQQ